MHDLESAEPLTWKQRLRSWWKRYRIFVWMLGFLLVFLVIILFPRIFHVVPAGHAAVLYRTLFGGTDVRYVRDEGLQIILPWDVLAVYDVRIQEREHNFPVLTTNGLMIHVVVSVRYHPRIEVLGLLHQRIGSNYVEKVILPETQALVRHVFGQYTPDEVYTTKYSLLQETLTGALGEMGEKFIVLDDLLIKTIILPEYVRTAIEEKLVEEQRLLTMQFRIDREKREVERKFIEATGVDLFQQIIDQSLNERLLEYKSIEAVLKGIDATLQLAQSPNSKLVIIGGKNGLPVILDASLYEPSTRSELAQPSNLLQTGNTNAPTGTNATNVAKGWTALFPNLGTNTFREALSRDLWGKTGLATNLSAVSKFISPTNK